MTKFVVGYGNAMVELDDGASRLAERLLRLGAPTVLAAIEKEVGQGVFRKAKKGWPWKSGRSKLALAWAVRIPNPNTVEGLVYNTADHTWYIRARKTDHKHTWTVLVRQPMYAATKRLAEQLGPLLARAGLGD